MWSPKRRPWHETDGTRNSVPVMGAILNGAGYGPVDERAAALFDVQRLRAQFIESEPNALIKPVAACVDKEVVHELAADLACLDRDAIVDFALLFAEHVAHKASDPDEIDDVLLLARAYREGKAEFQECVLAAADLNHVAAARPPAERPPLRAAYYAAMAICEPFGSVEHVLRAADCACYAASNWDAERRWQREQVDVALQVGRGAIKAGRRLRPSMFAGRRVAGLFRSGS